MFLAIIGGAELDKIDLDYKSNKHFEFLKKTKLVGELGKHIISEGLLLYYDQRASHYELEKSEFGTKFLAGYSSIDVKKAIFKTEDSNYDGEFIAFEFDASSKMCRVFNSFAGSWPIYYGERDGIFVVSNDALYIAVVLGFRDLNVLTFYQLLSFGHRIGDESTIKGVRALQFDEEIEINLNDGICWKLNKKNSVPSYMNTITSTEKTLQSLINDTKNNIALQSRISKSIIQLSGGLDSRLTLGVMSRSYEIKPLTQTLVLIDENESLIAQDVAESMGYDNLKVSLQIGDEEFLRTGWILTSGQISPYAAATNIISYRSALDLVDSNEVCIIGAWPGDCLIGSYVPRNKFFTLSKFHEFTIKLWIKKRNFSFEELGVSAKKKGGGRNESSLLKETRNILRTKIHYSNAATAAQKISYWAMFHRQPNFSYLAPSILSNRILQITPVLGRTYILELLKLSANDIYAKNFYRKLILESFPETANIVYDRIGKPINSDYKRPDYFGEEKKDLTWLIPNFLLKGRRKLITTIQFLLGMKKPVVGHKNEEVNHWDKVISDLAFTKQILIDETRLNLNDNATLHAKCIFLSQFWTLEYLHSFEAQAT